MTCQQCLAQTSEYLDCELPVTERERVEVHLARCPSCARYVRVLRRGLELVHALPEVQPSCDFQDRLRHRLFHVQDEMARPSRFSPSGTALTLAVAGLIAFAAWGPLSDDRVSYVETTSAATLEAGEALGLGGSDAWFLGAPTFRSGEGPPSMALAFPGPYSPLIVQPPVPVGSGSRVQFSSLGLE
jgi:hypothetical protein